MIAKDKNNDELDSLLLNVKDKLNIGASDDCSIEIEKQVEFEFSDVIFIDVKCDDNHNKYLIKKIRQSELNKTLGKCRSEQEYLTLEKLYKIFKHAEHISTPKPVLHIKEYDALVMEAYDMELMQNEMKSLQYFTSLKGFEMLRRHFLLCGIWLKTFYDSSQQEYSDVNILDDLADQIELRLDKLGETGHKLLPNNFSDTIKSQLRLLINRLSNKQILMSEQHGDFGVWNILSSGENIVVIDLTGCEIMPNGIDFISTIVFLDSMRSNPFHNKKRIDIVINEFVKGYGSTIKFDKDVWDLIEFVYRTRELVGAVWSPDNWRFDFLANRSIDYQLKWLLDMDNRIYLRSRGELHELFN